MILEFIEADFYSDANHYASKTLANFLSEGKTKVFLPVETDREAKLNKYRQWVEACHRFKHWHNGRQ